MTTVNNKTIKKLLAAPLSWRHAMRIARQVFPDIPHTKKGRDFLGYAIWNETGWPHFWTGDPATCLRRQLEEYRDGKS